MRIFIATLGTETNSFSPVPTGLADFHGYEYFDGDGSRRPPIWGNVPLIEWRLLAEADGHAIVESLCAFAQPAGPVAQPVYEAIRDRILSDLMAAKADLVPLNLHGAMIATGEDDCEGDLLARARALVGPDVPVLAELDLHAVLSERMVAAATMLVSYKEYPHLDVPDRARDLYRLGVAAAERRIRPVPALAPIGFIQKLRPTRPPMRGFVDDLYGLERDGAVLSVSLIHSFPFADTPDLGAKLLAYGDGEAPRALVGRLRDRLWAMRAELKTDYLDIDGAIDAALAAQGTGPAVISDSADNTGSGAPGDSSFILRRLIERGVTDAALGGLWDPIAVQLAAGAGVGTRFALRLGGKTGPSSGTPIDAVVHVRAVAADYSQAGLAGGRQPMGASAWLTIDGVDVIVVSQRIQTLSTDLFTGLGCTLDDKRIVVVKSAQHFHASFAPIARAVIHCAAPGSAPPDFRLLDYRKAPKLWPLDG